MHRSCAHVVASCHPCLNTDPFSPPPERETDTETVTERKRDNDEKTWQRQKLARLSRVFLTFCASPYPLPPRRTDSSNRFSPTTRRQDAPIGNLSPDRLRYFPSARRPPPPSSPSAPLQPRVLIGISGFYGTLGLDNAGTSDIGDRR